MSARRAAAYGSTQASWLGRTISSNRAECPARDRSPIRGDNLIKEGHMSEGVVRCAWSESHPLLQEYHDTEWGVPVHDDRVHFEYLVLDGAQAGLNWLIVLKKREGYRAAF